MFSLKIKSVPRPYHYQWLASSKSVCRKVGTYPPSQAMTTKIISPANLRWLKTSEVCDLLGVTEATLSKWRARGCAPEHIRLPNGDLRFSQTSMSDFIALCAKRRAKNAR
ncbi:Helix-turn-helix domain, group 17 [Candidatus Nanopelagicaceae bacterium]